MPDSLLSHPCKAQPSGETLIELGKAYNTNTSCIAKYKALVNKQIEWNKRQEKLYDNP